MGSKWTLENLKYSCKFLYFMAQLNHGKEYILYKYKIQIIS